MKNLKPFDLQAALSGKAVMLRDGLKAYVRHHETELPVEPYHELLGYKSDGTCMTWCTNGGYYDTEGESDADIIGMYPETKVINGFEVPAPEAQAPSLGGEYYLANPCSPRFHEKHFWNGFDIEIELLKRGLVFLSAEDAIATAKAMLGIDPNSEAES